MFTQLCMKAGRDPWDGRSRLSFHRRFYTDKSSTFPTKFAALHCECDQTSLAEGLQTVLLDKLGAWEDLGQTENLQIVRTPLFRVSLTYFEIIFEASSILPAQDTIRADGCSGSTTFIEDEGQRLSSFHWSSSTYCLIAYLWLTYTILLFLSWCYRPIFWEKWRPIFWVQPSTKRQKHQWTLRRLRLWSFNCHCRGALPQSNAPVNVLLFFDVLPLLLVLLVLPKEFLLKLSALLGLWPTSWDRWAQTFVSSRRESLGVLSLLTSPRRAGMGCSWSAGRLGFQHLQSFLLILLESSFIFWIRRLKLRTTNTHLICCLWNIHNSAGCYWCSFNRGWGLRFLGAIAEFPKTKSNRTANPPMRLGWGACLTWTHMTWHGLHLQIFHRFPQVKNCSCCFDSGRHSASCLACSFWLVESTICMRKSQTKSSASSATEKKEEKTNEKI